MMDQSGKFDFCPKCGALARDGVCQSCGYHLKNSVPKNDMKQGSYTYSSEQVYQANQDTSNGTKKSEGIQKENRQAEQNQVVNEQQNAYTDVETSQGYAE